MSFRRWVRHQDLASMSAFAEVASWIGASLLTLVFIAIGAWAPVTSDYLQLDPRGPAAIFGLCAAWSVPSIRRAARLGAYDAVYWVATVVGAGLLDLFCVSLVLSASRAGAAVFAPVLVAKAALHGHIHRVTPTEPFLALGLVTAWLIGLAWPADADHHAVLAVTGPTAVFAMLTFGAASVRADRQREERERLRAAIAAQQLADQSKRISELQETLVDVLGRNHDVNNLVLAAATNARLLTSQPAGALPGDVGELARDLDQALTALSGLVKEAMARGREPQVKEADDQRADVDVAKTVSSAVAAARMRHPHVRIDVDVAREKLVASVAGGAPSLTRVVLNLLLNACEGDGQRRASEVIVRAVRHHQADAVVLEVADDGPGFPVAMLTGPPSAFRTTKPDGTGLGLFVVDRLVAASGGKLKRSNVPGRGATVRIELPAAP